MSLKNKIDEVKKTYSTDSYPMSLGEITNLYRDDELKLNPTFQRYFRWDDHQKSKFIESIMLDIPIPSIFVYQNQNGIWEIVDGLQRVSTWLQFQGLLRDENDEKLPPLILKGTELLPEIEGFAVKGSDKKIPSELMIDLKRRKLHVQIIKNDSDPDAKFEVFQRLNTGGAFLSPQELRNSLLVLINKDFYEWVERLSKKKEFLKALSLTKKKLESRYEMELVLRLLVMTHFKWDKRKNVSEFLTSSMRKLAKDSSFDRNKFEITFNLVFESLVSKVENEGIFRKSENFKLTGGFLESGFEAIAYGVFKNSKKLGDDAYLEKLKEKVHKMWSEDGFKKFSGSGSNASSRIPGLIEFSESYFS